MAESDVADKVFSDEVNEEIEALKAIYSEEGEFRMKRGDSPNNEEGSTYLCIITISPRDMIVAICFSIPASYPANGPRIEIIPRKEMADDQISKLLIALYQVAQENLGSSVIYSLVESAKYWLQENPLCENDVQDKTIPAETQEEEGDMKCKKAEKGKGKQKPQQKNGEDSIRSQKKPPMKTATDVISRIQWDDQVNSDHFVVGYLDRFVGILEQPFNSFYWEDISAVDQHTLAIPRHRIQYFKYKDEIVWDKTKRLDNVFGSQGSGVTITDVVDRFSKENASEDNTREKETDDSVESDCEFENDDKFQNSATLVQSVSGRTKVNKSRPNYFLAIRIVDDDIKSCVKKIQNDMLECDSNVSQYLIPAAHLHITLCMLQLTTESQVNNALSVLKSIHSELISMLLPVTIIRFKGLDTFHDRIIFAKPEENQTLNKLSKFVRESLKNAGISLLGTRDEFVPHMTIMKMYGDDIYSSPIFSSNVISNHVDTEIGCQMIDSLHLSQIMKPAPDRFYDTIARINLVD